MKKLFTIDDFMVAFIAALGYGFGENIAKLPGWPLPACIAACFALGRVRRNINLPACGQRTCKGTV